MKRRKPRHAFRRTGGFTLLEMVIVLGIISLILGGAIYAARGIIASARLTRVQADFNSLQSALVQYRTNAGHYPSTAQGLLALTEKPTTQPLPRQWTAIMKDIPLDPWDQPYGYRFPGSHDPAEPEILSSGPDQQFGTTDDLTSQEDDKPGHRRAQRLSANS